MTERGEVEQDGQQRSDEPRRGGKVGSSKEKKKRRGVQKTGGVRQVEARKAKEAPRDQE